MNAPTGSDDDKAELFTPEQRKRNLILGSLLGLLVLVMIASEIAMFQANGFPKDPDEWDRLQHRSMNADGTGQQPSQNQTSATPGDQSGTPAQGSR